jgi:hypothetical protein
MAELKAAKAEAKPEQHYEYVTIPERDLFDYPMHSFWMNSTEYKPGTHFVPADIAVSLRERLTLFQRGQIRIMQPNIDRKAVNDANGFRAAGTAAVVAGDSLNGVFVQ